LIILASRNLISLAPARRGYDLRVTSDDVERLGFRR